MATIASVNARIGWKGLTAAEYVNEGFAFLAAPDIKGSKIEWTGANFITKERYDESPEIALRRGDVLLVKDGSIGIVAVVRDLPRPTTVNGSIAVLRPKAVDSEFLALWLESTPMQEHMGRMKDGMGVPHLFQRDIRKFKVPLPNRHDQARIAYTVRKETDRIDALINQKERLLVLLEEKRQAIISHAVTKGLNRNTEMKRVGVEWLGEVPSRWRVLRARFLCDITTGERDTQDAVEEGPYPFFVRSDVVERANTFSFDGEGVLTSGDGAGVGKVFHHYKGKMEIHQRVYLFHNFRYVLPRFFYHYLREQFQKVTLAGTAKSTVDSLRRPMLADFPVTVPPLAEQQAIVSTVEEAVTRLKELSTKIVLSIALLRERSQALITAAVTGQLDPSVYMGTPQEVPA